MNASLLAIRSIGAAFANRLFYPILVISITGTIITLGLIVWLTTLSQWWLLLAIPIVMLGCVSAGVLVIAKLVINSVTPTQSAVQKKAAGQFADKLTRLSEATQTPKFILFFRIVKDVAAPSEHGFIGTLSQDTTSLDRDFKAVCKLFESR